MKSSSQKAIWGAVAAASVALSALPVSAQTSNTNASATAAGPLAHAERAAELFAGQAVSSDGQKIGKVDNAVLDLESGRILYVVLNTSKGKVAVSPQLFSDTKNGAIYVNAPRAKLEGAPQFTGANSQPAQLGQAGYVAQVYQYFGQPAWWQGGAPATAGSFHNVHELTQLMHQQVLNVNSQPIGKVNNVVVDPRDGRIMYVVLAPDPSLNLGNNLYTLPPEALTLSADQKHLVSNINPQKLAAAPHFQPNHWPNLKDPTFASQVYQYYGKQPWFGAGGGVQPTGR